MKQSIQSGTLSSEHSATTARERIPRVSLNFTATDSGETHRKMVGKENHPIIFVRTRKRNPKENIMNITGKIIYGVTSSPSRFYLLRKQSVLRPTEAIPVATPPKGKLPF